MLALNLNILLEQLIAGVPCGPITRQEAEQIIRAVNAFPALVEALEHAKNALAQEIGVTPDACIGGPFVRINKALKLAKGE
jgi:hypothetical protein